MRRFLKQIKKADRRVFILMGGAAQQTSCEGVVERVGWRCVIVREEGAAAKATRYAVPYSAIIFVGEKLAPNK